MRDRSLEVRLRFVSLALVVAFAAPAAALTEGQARCVGGLGRAFDKVERAVARQTADCLKRNAKGKPLVPEDPSITSVHQCNQEDRTGAVARAERAADALYSKLCMPPPEGKLTDPYPPFGATDAAVAMVAGHAVARSLAVDVFGVLIDEALVRDPAGAKCQQAAWSALLRCEQARTRAFLLCQKAGIRAEDLDERDELRELCLGAGGASQPDPRGRVAAACTEPGTGIGKALGGPCAGADLVALFPGCAAEGDTQACLARKAACRACRATSRVGDLRRSCDLFDDGERNRSCADESALSCESPAEGAMVTAAPQATIEVAGQVEGPEITEVLVDGAPVPVDAEGWFAAQVAPDFGVHFHEVAVPGGDERVCTFLAAPAYGGEAAFLPDALELRLAQEALDDGARGGDPSSLGDLLHLALVSPELQAELHDAMLATPLKPLSCDQELCIPIVGCTCVLRSRVRYTSSSIATAGRAVSLDFVPGGVSLALSLPSVTVGLRADGDVSGIPFDVTGTVSFASLAASLISDVEIEGGAVGTEVRFGSTSATVGTPGVNVDGVPAFVDDLIADLAGGVIQDVVRDLLVDLAETDLNSLLSDVLAGLSIPSTGIAVPRFGGAPIPLSLDAEPSSVTTNAERSLLGLAARVQGPAAQAHPSLGVARPPGLQPADPAGTPVAYAGGIVLLNQTLHALWRGGAVRGAVDTSGFPELEPGVIVVFEGMLPPVVAAGDGDALRVQLGALHVHTETAGPPIGGPPSVVSLGADATATLGFGADGALLVESLAIDQVYVTGLDVPIPPELRPEAEAFAAELIALVLGPAVAGAVRALPPVSLALPPELEDLGVPAGSRFGIVDPALDATPTHVEVGGDPGLL